MNSLMQWLPNFSGTRNTSNILVLRQAQNVDFYRDWRTTWANLVDHQRSAEQIVGTTDLMQRCFWILRKQFFPSICECCWSVGFESRYVESKVKRSSQQLCDWLNVKNQDDKLFHSILHAIRFDAQLSLFNDKERKFRSCSKKCAMSDRIPSSRFGSKMGKTCHKVWINERNGLQSCWILKTGFRWRQKYKNLGNDCDELY